MTTLQRKALATLAAHGIEAQPMADGNIRALEHYTINGVPGSQWVVIPPASAEVRDWLGY